ncbi:MAG: glycosyltransferase family 2 protein [Alphaproteobacteria bacterium]|nr:glycosyltransferase family 2 protein [Alphaproteobacteria bacterium]
MEMGPQFRLSVVIPNRNRAHSLLRAVLSLRDTEDDIEIIVVDDCSDADLAAEYGMLRSMGVRIVRQEKHLGGCAARNRGVREASGTHVSFLDSDDVWLPGRYDRIRQFYARPGNTDTVLVSGVLLHVDGEIQKPHQPEWKPGSSLVDYVYRDTGRVQTSMLNLPVAMARACPWNEALRVNQDTDLAMRLDRAGFAFHIDQEPGVIKEETIRPGRLTTGAETADRSYAWYLRESVDWSPAAKSGYHLQDRVWRLADAGRRREAIVALARTLNPPVSPRETARRALTMLGGPHLYARLRQVYRSKLRQGVASDPALRAARQRWEGLDNRAQAICGDPKMPILPRSRTPARELEAV